MPPILANWHFWLASNCKRLHACLGDVVLIVWLAALFVGTPDIKRLGADDWTTRERETQRCDCFWRALFLPTHDANPEIDRRVQLLRTGNLRWLDAEYIERRIYRHSFEGWAKRYLVHGPSRLARAMDVVNGIWNDDLKTNAVLRLLKIPPSWDVIDFCDPAQWNELLDYNWQIAPMPRRKDSQ